MYWVIIIVTLFIIIMVRERKSNEKFQSYPLGSYDPDRRPSEITRKI